MNPSFTAPSLPPVADAQEQNTTNHDSYDSAASTRAAIAVHDVSKRFGSLTALDQVSFEVEVGEVVGLVGANGAGKTTLIRLLTDLARPSAGTLTIGGSPTDQVAARHHIGVLLGGFVVPERLSCADFLQHIDRLRPRELRTAWTEIEDLADRFGLNLSRRADQLSRGNLQKLGLIQAFMHRPDVILLDEPTSGLDPIIQRVLRNLIAERAAEGVTFLVSSHILSEVREVATRIVALNEGRIVADGSLEDILAQAGRSVTLDAEGDVAAIMALLDNTTVERRGTTWHLVGTFNGPPALLVETLAQVHVIDLAIGEPRLEDAVLDLYQPQEPREEA